MNAPAHLKAAEKRLRLAHKHLGAALVQLAHAQVSLSQGTEGSAMYRTNCKTTIRETRELIEKTLDKADSARAYAELIGSE